MLAASVRDWLEGGHFITTGVGSVFVRSEPGSGPNGGHRIAHLLSSYLDERVKYAERWHGAVRDWTKPLSFLWALDDPVATPNVLDGLRLLRPAADVVELPGVGHYPQVEVPEEFTARALALLSG